MAPILSFRDLIAWQKAMLLAELIYDVTDRFPHRERFGLALQMRKSAVSIPSNIAEGHRRRTPGYVHHLEIALGSHGEHSRAPALTWTVVPNPQPPTLS
jgi:four helix bundle protein